MASYDKGPKRATITIHRGKDFVWLIGFRARDGEPVDVTGCTLEMAIRKSLSAAPLIRPSSATGEVTLVPGKFLSGEETPFPARARILIPSDINKDFPFGEFVFDQRWTWSDGISQPLYEGPCFVKWQATETADD